MTKQILLSSALVPLLFAWGCGDGSKSSDAASLTDTGIRDGKPADTGIISDGKPADKDAGLAGETAKPLDAWVADAVSAEGGAIDGQTVDAPLTDAKIIDAPAGELLAGETGGDTGKPVDVAACTPSLEIVRVSQDSIDIPTTWTAGKVYVVEQSIVLNSVLTIEPGVVVKFTKGPSISMKAGGAIVADGKSAAGAIVFTSIKDDAHGGDSNNDCGATTPAPGDWAAIKISQANSVFNYAQFFYGGSQKPYTGSLSVSADAVATITNCTFAYNDGGTLGDNRAAALSLAGAGVGTKLTGNTFYGNVIPLVINANINVDNSNVFSSQPASAEAGTAITNKYNGIFMDGVSYSVTSTVTWSNITVPYVFYQIHLVVDDGGSLTLADGVVLKSWKSRVEVAKQGTLNQGTGVAFTSFNDDSRLGDSNADGTATTPTKGDWVGVSLCQPSCKPATWANIFYASNI
jgi:hypothetical protein